MQKTITIDGIESPVILMRRKGTRALRIAIKNNQVKVSVPYGIPELMAKKFVRQKASWINQHVTETVLLQNGDHIGKAHRIRIQSADTLRTRVTTNEIILSLPTDQLITEATVQRSLTSACERALKKQAEQLLPQRIDMLSVQHDMPYRSLTIKKLTSRWGSCDSRNNIVLSIFLLQLPWHLIDYVIKHELIHTIHHHHQASFWEALEQIAPGTKALRKELKPHKTAVTPNT